MAITNPITVFTAPEAYQAQYRAATGYEWSVDGLWDADNRRRGAEVSFYINKPQRPAGQTAPQGDNQQQMPAPQQQQGGGGGGGGRGGGGGFGGGQGGQGQGSVRRGDSAMVRIFNDKNELIRTIRWNVDSGFNRQYWGMEEKGFRQPGSPKPRPGSPEPEVSRFYRHL
jgi:hypothetical protein